MLYCKRSSSIARFKGIWDLGEIYGHPRRRYLNFKKQHPCGSKDWEVLRIGADFRLKCKGCDHQIMIPRPQAEKNIRNIQRKEDSE